MELMDLEIRQVLELLKTAPALTPMERILLGYPGTLMGLLSRYFGREVKVRVVSQRAHGEIIEHVAELHDAETVVCRADSRLYINRDDVRAGVWEERLGLGQILQALQMPLSFSLVAVGQDARSLSRTYELHAAGVHCEVSEVFPRGLYRWPDLQEEMTLHVLSNESGWEELWVWLLEDRRGPRSHRGE